VRPYAIFIINPSLPPLTEAELAPPFTGELLRASLRGTPAPETGTLETAAGFSPAAGPGGDADGALTLDGTTGRVVYTLDLFPDEEYALTLWARLDREPSGSIGQIVSAWTTQADDPLRLCVIGGKLYGRLEAGAAYSTPGVPLAVGVWHHVALVKEAATLTLYVDGEVRGKALAPLYPLTKARALGVGGNPRHPAGEYVPVTVRDLVFQAKALSAAEIAALTATE
jgi:hypothetical protein